MARMSVHFSSETDLWATPDHLFAELDAEFGFTLDVCATKANAKCNAYFTKRENGLDQDWSGVCWMNPPYGREIGQWVRKARESAACGATVVCLIPARTDTSWWHADIVHADEIRFVRGRLRFGDASNSAPFPSAIVIFRGKPPRSTNWSRAAFFRRSKRWPA
ncbi:MAG: phage N-6-adenine-methyltransferase [Phycisphaerales bacterium]